MEKLFAGLIISSILLLTCIGMLSFAWADEYRTLGIKHATNPQVCIFEPDILYTDDVDGVVQASYNSINLWKDGLREHSPKGNWDMSVVVIPSENHKYKNAREFPTCSILISFEYTNQESSSLGYTGIDFSSSKHKYAHIVVYLREVQVMQFYEWDMWELEQKMVKTEVNILPFSLISIQNTITHELGHSLGLGHYLITDAPVSDNPWVTRSVMYYAMNPHSGEIMIPTYVDIKMVELLYKEDGFGGSTSYGIKAGYYTTGDDEICTFKCSFSRAHG